jgi:excisionase family DNA binding protein
MQRPSRPFRSIVVRPEEQPEVEKVLRYLDSRLPDDPVGLTSWSGPHVRLPHSILVLLREATRLLAANEEVAVLSFDRELTSTQAADILGMSRPFVVKLLDSGRIPSHAVGRHRRAYLRDVLAYRDEREKVGTGSTS